MSSKLFFAPLLLSAVVSATPIPPALTPYEIIDLSGGQGIGSGALGSGHVIFSFDAIAGQRLDLQVIVTEVHKGTQAENDDSMLWVFCDVGHLLASNDNYGDGLQSRIPNFLAEYTGTYFVGVTSFQNVPIMTDEMISGWTGTGGSAFAFDLRIADVPEPAAFTLIGLGALALGLARRFRAR